jgi:hypothetical protein
MIRRKQKEQYYYVVGIFTDKNGINGFAKHTVSIPEGVKTAADIESLERVLRKQALVDGQLSMSETYTFLSCFHLEGGLGE